MTPKAYTATTTIGAPAEHVWSLLADVTRMGEWSPECRRCEWIDGATGPAVGARFTGTNVSGPIRWTTTCRITRADTPYRLSFEVLDHGRTSSRWDYRFEPVPEGTRFTETFEFVWCPWYSRAGELFLPRTRQLRSGVDETLRRIKATAEAKPHRDVVERPDQERR